MVKPPKRIYRLYQNADAFIHSFENKRIVVTDNIEEAADFTNFEIQELDWLEVLCYEFGFEEAQPYLYHYRYGEGGYGYYETSFHRCAEDEMVLVILDEEV